MAHWILTHHGHEFSFKNINWEDVYIEDIAFSLARIRRFNGHASANCSVALHSVMVLGLIQMMGYDENMQRWAILHDAHEAYLGDIASPIKPYLRDLEQMTVNIDGKIYNRFKVSRKTGKNWITYADLCCLKYERDNFMPPGRPWPILDDIPPIAIDDNLREFYFINDPNQHEQLFIDKCKSLGLL